MGSVERIRNVARRVAKWHAAGHQVVVVPSAMAGETNRLLGLAREISPVPDGRELDMIAATGEQASSGLLAIALQAEGVAARSYAGWQVPVRTDSSYTKARITSIDDARIRADLDAGRVVIVTGFQGVDADGHITTLGRGGSDTSAVAVAAAIKADECLIYTDVDGVYTTDPRVVPEARRMAVVSFEEMLEMASLGSKVLQIRSVEFAGKYRVPTRVLSSLTDPLIPLEEEMHSGTLITLRKTKNGSRRCLRHRLQPRRSQDHLAGRAGQARHRLLHPGPGRRRQHRRRHDRAEPVRGRHDRLSFTVNRNEFARAVDLLKREVIPAVGARELSTDEKVAKVSIVGIGMRSHVGVASLMFQTLSQEGINIQMISTSEIKTSVIIDDKYMELGVRALHKAFGLDQAPAAKA